MLKVISYNIHSGKDLLMRSQLDKIISFLKNQSAHIVGIQEVNENKRRGYQFRDIKQGLNIDSSFAPNVKIGNGYYGVALFTSLKIATTNHILLPSAKEQRGLLHITVEIGNKKLEILNTHLGLRESERKTQFEFIENYIKGINTPYILMGDFNTTHPSLTINDMVDTAKL